jgi:hypothetical protein
VDVTSPRAALVASGIAVFAVTAFAWPALSRAAASDREAAAPPA